MCVQKFSNKLTNYIYIFSSRWTDSVIHDTTKSKLLNSICLSFANCNKWICKSLWYRSWKTEIFAPPLSRFLWLCLAMCSWKQCNSIKNNIVTTRRQEIVRQYLMKIWTQWSGTIISPLNILACNCLPLLQRHDFKIHKFNHGLFCFVSN